MSFSDMFKPISSGGMYRPRSSGDGAATPNPPEDDCTEGFCPMPLGAKSPSPAAAGGSASDPDVVQPSSMEALLQDVLTEADTEAEEVVKELLRERLNEIRRMEDLLAKAKADLAALMQRDPKEIAASVDCPPGIRINGGFRATTGAMRLRAARGGDSSRNSLAL